MMSNYEIVEFIALMQRLIGTFTIFETQKKKKSVLRFYFLFLN